MSYLIYDTPHCLVSEGKIWGKSLLELCLCLFLLKESTWKCSPFSSYFKQSHNRSNSVLNLKCYASFTRGVGVNAWRRPCLKLGVEATVTVTRANHITFLVLHEWNWLASELGYLHKANALPFEKLKNVLLLPRAMPVKRHDEPTIQFGKAWCHSIQSKQGALTPTLWLEYALGVYVWMERYVGPF